MRTTTQVAAISGNYDHQKVRPFPAENPGDTPFITLELHDHTGGVVPGVQLFFGADDLPAVRELIVNLGRVQRFLEAQAVQTTVEDLQHAARAADDAGVDVDDTLDQVDQGIPVDEAIAHLTAAQDGHRYVGVEAGDTDYIGMCSCGHRSGGHKNRRAAQGSIAAHIGHAVEVVS